MNSSKSIPSTAQSHPQPTQCNRLLFRTMMGLFIGFVATVGILSVLMYKISVPALVQNQVELRAESITKLLAASVLPSLAVKDYLNVNKITEAAAKLPDVGYATVISANDIAISGIFGDISKFDAEFVAEVNNNGFPAQLIQEIRLNQNVTNYTRVVHLNGLDITEYATRLGNTGAEVHVGLLTSSAIEDTHRVLVPHTLLLLIMVMLSGIAVFWVSRLISASTTAQ